MQHNNDVQEAWGTRSRRLNISGPICGPHQDANLAHANAGDDWSKRKHLQNTRSVELECLTSHRVYRAYKGSLTSPQMRLDKTNSSRLSKRLQPIITSRPPNHQAQDIIQVWHTQVTAHTIHIFISPPLTHSDAFTGPNTKHERVVVGRVSFLIERRINICAREAMLCSQRGN